MTGEGPLPFEGASELRRMLRDLGQSETNPPRGAQAEAAREARMAASMDAELARLVSERQRERRRFGVALAAAAVLALGFGLRHRASAGGSLAISQEPLIASSHPAGPVAGSLRVAPPLDSVTTGQRAPLRTIASAPGKPVAPPASAAPSAAPPAPQSTLAEENQLFKEAAEAGRSGDVAGALGRLEQLIRNYPRSPLAQTAMVRKFRLMAKSGRTDEARGEAQRYLEAYPTGFAVSEAQALQQGAVPPPAAADEVPPTAPSEEPRSP